MSPSTIIGAVLGTALLLSGVALYFTGQAYLSERDKNAVLEFDKQLAEQAREAKADKEQALADLRKHYEGPKGVVTQLIKSHKEVENDLTAQLLSAREDAAQKPIEFGDDIIRDLVRLDCLWASGEASASVQGRATCSREADAANTTRKGFSVITPSFLKAWGDACEDWPRVGTGEGDLAYTREIWDAEYGYFDPQLCSETLVAFTPEFSVYLRKFIVNGENLTAQLWGWGRQLSDMVDIVTQKPVDKGAGSH